MSATFSIDQKGNAFARITLTSAQASTFHADRITLDAVAAVAEADSIVEDAFIRSHYTIVPQRTIDDLVRAYEARMARRPRKKYIDIDLPIEDDDAGGDW